eukprot:3970348-Pyramimonas_sp.AAC.1
MGSGSPLRTSAGKAKSRVRNLGHELSEPEPIRDLAKSRLAARGRAPLTQHATTRCQISALMPAAAHGGTVSGTDGNELTRLRKTAAMLAGRISKFSSLALVLATQAE